MLTSFSSNAILSKARAMYGKRLKKEDFAALLACKSVSEVASYLKKETVYARNLAGVNTNEIHRGQLENHLRQKLFEDYASLSRYELSVGEHFADYLLSNSEIEQILHSLVLLEAGRPAEYLFYMPPYLSRHTKIDLVALSRLKTFGELLSALSGTPYRALLEPFQPAGETRADYTGIENALYTFLYQNVTDIIEKHTHGENREQLRNLFFTYADLTNTVRIFRLKKAYGESPGDIRSLLLPFGGFSPRMLQRLLDADADEVLDTAFASPTGRQGKKTEYDYPDQLPLRVRYRMCRHHIRFSTHPSVVMISYIFLSQTELLDIINIVEGIRYQLPPAEIKKLLTAADYLS